MATQQSMADKNNIPEPKRFITTHEGSGLAVFSQTVPLRPPHIKFSDGMKASLCYATTQFPAVLASDQDLETYQSLTEKPPGIVVAGGSVARFVDFPPGHVGTMHRTQSINYNFVIQGQLELVLDSGETRFLGPGDMVVQRATNHFWKNPSQHAWARIAAMALPTEQLSIGGKLLESEGSASLSTSS